MGSWLAASAVVALVLIAVARIGPRRPRHAEDELRLPSRRADPKGAPGSFDSSSLRKWLLSAMAQRRTGTLQLTAGGRTRSLYFLFGHLFHVASATITGERALQECLTSTDLKSHSDAE